MRYFLSIDLDKQITERYTFSGTELSKYLKVENSYSIELNINLTTIQYDRCKPGLIEKNWAKPFFNCEDKFIFIGGSVLYRNGVGHINPTPSPKEVLKIVEENGSKLHRYIKGEYFIILHDKIQDRIELYSSPMFMHPAFYYFNNHRFYFSNFIGAFIDYIPMEIDQQGLIENTLFDHCIHSRTIYRNIKMVPGGHLITFSEQGIQENLIYDIANWYCENPRERIDSLDSIRNELKVSIKKYINSTEKFNTALTGGFDGRLNFSFLDKKDYSRLQAFSYGIEGSAQISIPQEIATNLGFQYKPIILGEEFVNVAPDLGMSAIQLSGGITGFNRAMYPYAYSKIKDFSRSCMLGQCDMIRPMFNNPAGVIFNSFSNEIFFGNYQSFLKQVDSFKPTTILGSELFDHGLLKNIYDDVKRSYIDSYKNLPVKLQFYFFMYKESIMKYWHTEFHMVDIFVDDYVPFADLDYLEALFKSEYAGIYKGLLVKSQFKRRKGQDLYVDLMSLNNDKLNWINLDRGFKPGFLKYGDFGWLIAAIMKKKQALRSLKKGNDTFRSKDWSTLFFNKHSALMKTKSDLFDLNKINENISQFGQSVESDYRLERMISKKIWLHTIGVDG